MTQAPYELDVENLVSYLVAAGWHQYPETWRGAGVWAPAEYGKRELLVPMDLRYRDSRQLLEAAVDELAKYEDRRPDEVLRDIAEPLVDKQEYRLHPPTPSGTVPLPTAVKAFGGVHNLLAAARRGLDEAAMPSFTGRRPATVTTFLRTVLLDTTSAGSYVMMVRVPLGQRGASGRPLGRRVVTRLHDAVSTVHRVVQAVAQTDSIRAFDSTVEHGVTQQLCEALVELGGPDKNQRFEIGIHWARGLESELPPLRVGFTEQTIEILDRGAKRLQELASAGRATMTGKIKEMHYAPAPHRVKVHGILQRNGDRREETVIWVQLNAAQYERASREHQSPNLTFQFTGQLSLSGRRLDMIIGSDGYATLMEPR